MTALRGTRRSPTRKPIGLWKAQSQRANNVQPSSASNNSDTDELESVSSTCSRARRLSSSSSSSSDSFSYYFCPSERKSCWALQTRRMDTSSTALPTKETTTCNLEDWADLKDLFNTAAERYENEDAAVAVPYIRAVIHECHRFLIFYPDPSILFTRRTPDAESPPARKKCKCTELPTAFHAILGTALFLFGNLIAQDSSLALEGEPNNPAPYWLAALDVFETGESLPSRTSGLTGYNSPEDWRMAIVWGRTLVCIADETLTRALKSKSIPNSTVSATFIDEEPDWPPDSAFAAIAARRPTVTRRMSLSMASANDLMVLAMDQFSRGIFHMPHSTHTSSPSSPGPSAPPLSNLFSRPKELFTIATEVLLVAEKMEVPSERQYWASWADSVFNQMKMEADSDTWRGSITAARGRCWLIVGSAKVEALEAAIEAGDVSALNSEDAQEAREGLTKAVDFLERATSSATSTSSQSQAEELKKLLVEALLTLANLTDDEMRREELYARAMKEGDGDFFLGEKMDES